MYDLRYAWAAGGVDRRAGRRGDRGLDQGAAIIELVRAKRLRGLPVTKAAWRDGALAGGQVTVIVERLGAQRTVRWSEHEAALVPGLGGLSIDDTTRAVDAWKAHADADGPTPPAQPQVLFPSRVGERWRTDGDFDALDGDIIGTAIRLATSPAPSPPQRGPHPEQLDTGAGGRTLSGMPVGGPDTELVLCDAVLHRVVMAGSEILDYGRAIRTTPAPLWNAVAIRDQRCRFAGCDRGSTPQDGKPNSSPTEPSKSSTPTDASATAGHHPQPPVEATQLCSPGRQHSRGGRDGRGGQRKSGVQAVPRAALHAPPRRVPLVTAAHRV